MDCCYNPGLCLGRFLDIRRTLLFIPGPDWGTVGRVSFVPAAQIQIALIPFHISSVFRHIDTGRTRIVYLPVSKCRKVGRTSST